MTFDEFFAKYNGSAIDYDGVAGVQCVDLVDRYLKDVFGITGVWVKGARELYTRFLRYPALTAVFERIPNTRELLIEKGDIVVWNGGRWGHTAVGTGKGTRDWFESFEQNTKGRHEPAHTEIHFFSGKVGSDSCNPVLGVLRPKNRPAASDGAKPCRVRVTYPKGLNVRKSAGIAGVVTGWLARGEVRGIIAEKTVGTQVWGRLSDKSGWICLTGFTERLS